MQIYDYLLSKYNFIFCYRLNSLEKLVFKYKWIYYFCIQKKNVMKLKINRRLGIVDFDISLGEMILILFIIKILIDCF